MRRLRLLLPALGLLALSSLLVPAGTPARAATSSPHYWVNACRPTSQGTLKAAVHRVLGRPLAWHQRRYNRGFSQCILASGVGTFVVLDLASSWMLSRAHDRRLTASEMANRLDEEGGLPPYLQYLKRGHREFLFTYTWTVGLNHDVVGIAMFGFFHRVNHKIPRFRHSNRRLTRFLDGTILAGF